MNIQPLEMTDTTVLLTRTDYEAMIAAIAADEDTADLALAQQVLRDIEEGRDEWVPIEIADRFLAGENRVRVWREHRGLTISELARQSGVDRAYLTEIETGKKPGSVAALRGLATALRIQIDDLVPPERE